MQYFRATHAALEGNSRLLRQVGATPLYYAALVGQAEVVEQLLGAGAAVDAADQVMPRPLLDD
jgi:ankyrin repeat protein